MSNRLSIKSLLNKFEPATKTDWLDSASREIKKTSQELIDELTWRDISGLQFEPYYDSKPTKQHHKLQIHGTHECKNIAPIDPNAHIEIESILKAGADGIEITLTTNQLPEFSEHLKSAAPFHLNLILDSPNDQTSFIKEILDRHHANKLNSSNLYGNANTTYLPSYSQCRILGIKIKGLNNPIEEVAEALFRGVCLIERFSEKGHPIDQVFPHVCFYIDSDIPFFSMLAKLKCIRRLWYQVGCAYNVSYAHYNDTNIHVRIGPINIDQYEPHSNMIYSAPAVLAAITGGANSISNYPQELENLLQSHTAMQVSNILKTESQVNRNSDPFAGSYFHEKQTHEYAKNAWALFQQKCSTL